MLRLCVLLAGLATLMTMSALAGSLSPPGPPAQTPGPEPRTAISAQTTPGDADSLFRITEPGSYYLMDNITGAVGKSGIEIAASDVTLDLMGFALEGVPGSGDGITYSGTSLRHWVLRNGTIRGWGVTGLRAYGVAGSRFEGTTSVNNGASGMQVGSDSILADCICNGNSGSGAVTEERCTLTRVTADSNGHVGINVGEHSILTDCHACGNVDDGISLDDSCTVVNTTADDNVGDGIGGTVPDHVLISGCQASSNGDDGINVGTGLIENCVCSDNSGDGIEALGPTIIRGNSCDSNGSGGADGAGIHTTSWHNRIEDNTVSNNDRGIDVDWHGNVVIRNLATANTSNYAISGTGAVGPIITATGTITSTNPWANFSY